MTKIFDIRNDAGAKPGWFSVRNDAGSASAEILIHGQIGKDWWSEDGVSEKEFLDALKLIPEGREITVGVNSEGGQIKAGLGIYNALQQRKDKITVRIDGYAVSIASIIALAGKRTISPKSSIWMIHEPWTVAQGNAEDFERASKMLDQHAEMLVDIYATHTGKTRDEIREAMKKETWMRGDEAVAFGLADEAPEEPQALDLKNNFDFTKLRNAPDYVKNLAVRNAATAKPTNQPKDSYMDRAEIIAALKARGDSVDESLSTEQLKAQLLAPPKAKGTNTPAPTPAAQPANVVDLSAITNELTALRKQRDDEKRARITARVNELQPNRIPVADVEAWVNDAMRDETVLNRLAAIKPQEVGAEPVNVNVTSEDPRDISKAVLNLWGGKQILSPAQAQERGLIRAQILRKNMDKLIPVLNASTSTHTIGADLKRVALLDSMIRAFAKRLTPLNAFSTALNGVVLEGSDTVAVPYYALETAASTAFVAADGYDTFSNTNTDSRKVTINQRYYQGLSWTSTELRRQPFLNLQMLASLKAEKLGVDVWTAVMGAVTVANFGAAIQTIPADSWSGDTIADVKLICDQSHWPEVGRSLILNSTIENALNKDTGFKSAMNLGTDYVIRTGKIPSVYGFDVMANPNVPTNSENLIGMAVFKSAILFAQAPIAPDENVRAALTRYEVVVDPETGASFEYRLWGDPDKDTGKEIIECNYGFVKGEAAALKRFTSQ